MKTATWYLPLSEPLAGALLNDAPLDVADLCRYQTAAILYLLHLPKLPANSAVAMQQAFARLLERPTATLKTFLAEGFEPAAFAKGLAHARAIGIELLDADTVKRHPFVHPQGTWDFDFAQRHRASHGPLQHAYPRPGGLIIRLSDHQLRLVQNIRANLEDSIEAQAHAGTGKTFVLEQVLELMPKGQCLLLADAQPKLQAVSKRFGDQVSTSTFRQLAEHLLARGNQLLKARMLASSRLPVHYAALAEQANLGPIGRRTPTQVAALCWSIIARFCATPDTSITVAHLPAEQLLWIAPAERQLLALMAEKLWFKIKTLNVDAPLLPSRGYHRIKQMMLHNLFIPEPIKMIIIDEGQDLSPAIVDFLNRSPQSVITLGDQFQNLDGRYVPHHASIRHREMAMSLRCGPSLVDYVNDLIEIFPHASTLPFTADKTKQTVVAHYPATTFPAEPCVILVADEWGLFDWLIRSRDEARGAAVIDWEWRLEGFMEGCLNLCLYDQPASHGLIARYANWAQLREVMAWNEAFLRVEHWLQTVGGRFGVSGLYRRAELAEFSWDTPMRPLLATVYTAKNFELPHMALSEDLYYFANLKGKRALSKKLALLYTAITRASGKIHFPDTHQERMAHIHAAL
ncbi:hypothetical protein [Pseudomonas sp. TE3610]